RQDLNTLEEESKMVYITSIEQLAKEEGMQAGMEKGMQQGMQQGLLKGKVQLLERQLWRRFGELPDWVHDHLSQAEESKLDGWTDAVLTATSLDGVFASDSH
ncbi:MAG: cytosolic protein, partial [Oxalobacteraceae bacterium]|nr:cytosolic protein [Oxalobacteraceae bacterium]